MIGKPSAISSELKSLSGEYMCVDMHYHTLYSDGAARLADIMGKVASTGIGVAITDHNTIRGAERIKAMEGSEKVIPGIEVKIRGNLDFLFYFYTLEELRRFYNTEVLPRKKGLWVFSEVDMSFESLLSASEKYRCVVSFAHPAKYPKILREKIMERIGSLEVINGGSSPLGNRETLGFAHAHHKSMTAGSDGHSIYELGECVTCSKAANAEEFLDNIRHRKTLVLGKELKFGKKERVFYNIVNRMWNIVDW